MTKTTYILAGGNDRLYEDYGVRLDEEIAKHVANPRILSCFYSQPEETWEERAEDWDGWLLDNFSQHFTYDYAKLDTLLDQIDSADVIYFHGGETKLLLDRLPDASILSHHLKNRVVIGSSAGANMLSRHFWSSTRGVYREGKGLVDLSVMVHYGAAIVGDNKRTSKDWRLQEEKFAAMVNMPITHLPEGQFTVITLP